MKLQQLVQLGSCCRCNAKDTLPKSKCTSLQTAKGEKFVHSKPEPVITAVMTAGTADLVLDSIHVTKLLLHLVLDEH